MTRMTTRFRFIDLFAGIGGIRFGFRSAGGTCVFSAEWDCFAQKTYSAFFKEIPDFREFQAIDPPGDISRLNPKNIPEFDILTAGFPCQPFSLAGVSKNNSLGRVHGFSDLTQGTMFFELERILKYHEPKAFFLENVKNLQSHDSGNTYRVIIDTLTKKLGYQVYSEVINAKGWVPQHRERIFIIGFHPSLGVKENEFEFPSPPVERIQLESIIQERVDSRYTLGPGTWSTLKRHREYHSQNGNGFGYELISPPFNGQVTRTISARYHKDGAEVLIGQSYRKRPRRLTPLECCRLMGFPKSAQSFFDPDDISHPQPVSDTQAYRQFGNSVVVPVVKAIAIRMFALLKRKGM